MSHICLLKYPTYHKQRDSKTHNGERQVLVIQIYDIIIAVANFNPDRTCLGLNGTQNKGNAKTAFFISEAC